ncbi:MAG: peptide chain release factor N(5)-glutamine methyltransferase [Rubricoccaceae bacterium]
MSETRLSLITSAADRLAGAGIEDARRTAEWMLEDVLGLSRTGLVAGLHEPVSGTAAGAFEALVARRLAREPVQYVLGHADFFGLRLYVSPAVLIPRPETEELVEDVLRRLAFTDHPWVLDVGTGSGAIALAVKHQRPDAEVFACDVSEAALAVARDNAERLGLDVTFCHADALTPAFADGVPATFHAVVSNPPYVPAAEAPTLEPEVRDFEPSAALFVPDADPLVFYRALAGHAPRLLRPGGHLVCETHADYGSAVRDLFAEAGLCKATIRRDLAGRERIAAGVWPG